MPHFTTHVEDATEVVIKMDEPPRCRMPTQCKEAYYFKLLLKKPLKMKVVKKIENKKREKM
jgi:hypothetical protein